MARPAFIAIDWGTSNARFALVGDDGSMLEERHGEGVAKIDGAKAMETACFERIDGWIQANGNLPVLMAGMVGSNIGWRETTYVETPASGQAIVASANLFEARGVKFVILPGVRTSRQGSGLPDLMRGEETQILGAAKDGLICLPGTHSKWALVSDGVIEAFHTAQTGELLDLLGKHSILLNPQRSPAAEVGPAFREGVKVALAGNLGIESLLFTVRSRQVVGDLAAADADSYLAGLLIGAELHSALALHGDAAHVQLIGSPVLTTLYAAALDSAGKISSQIGGQAACLAGLAKAHESIFR